MHNKVVIRNMLYYLLEQIYVETNEKGLTQAQHEYQKAIVARDIIQPVKWGPWNDCRILI